jgi:hypothetical protein
LEIVGFSSTFWMLAPDDGFEGADFASVISVINWMGAADLSDTLVLETIQMVKRPLRNERPVCVTE